MPRKDPEPENGELEELREQLADAQAQIEALQSAAADAEARAATARGDAGDARAELADVSAQLAEARAAQAELADILRGAALKYREARLAATPHVPPDLVPGETLEEIDRQLEAAQRVVSQVRDQVQSEAQPARVPLGAPARRAPDLSALSAEEKIRLGLQQRSER